MQSPARSLATLIGDRRNLDMQVDSVQQWPADLAQILLDNAAGTTALAARIAMIAARTSVQVLTEQRQKGLGQLENQPMRFEI